MVFISALLPGIAIGWPLLKKSELSALERLLLCFFIGMFAVPTILFVEGLLGIKFSFALVLADILILTTAGAANGIRMGAWKLKLSEIGTERITSLEFAKKHATSALLLLAIILAFWIRIQTVSPIYSELDPYFYIYGSGQIIREGIVPSTDDTAWWPEVSGTHRTVPLKMYLEAEWYSLYTQGGKYDKYVLFATSSWLPPLSAAFVSFGTYLLIASIYGRRYGVFAAFAMAFLPSTIFKMSAGVNEAAPVGMMMLFLSMGAFAWTLTKRDNVMRLITAFVFFATAGASNFQHVVALPFSGLVILQSLDYFIRGKKHEDFVVTCTYAFAGMFTQNILVRGLYTSAGLTAVFSGIILISAGALLLTALLNHLIGTGIDRKRRLALLAGATAFGMLLAVFSPAGEFVKGELSGYVGVIDYNSALARTIAEQNRAGSAFEGEGGFLALLPKNHIASNAAGPQTVMNAIYGALGILAEVATALGNLIFAALDLVFRILLGTTEATGQKDNSLLFVFLCTSIFGLALRHVSRRGDDRDVPSVPLLILLLTIPILYIGVNKIKFTVFAGMMIGIIASTGMAEIEMFFGWLLRKLRLKEAEKYVPALFTALLILVAYAQAAGPIGYAKLFILKSFEMRYQDNPPLMAPKAAKLCEDLRGRGVAYNQIKELCDAGADPNFASSIDNQYNLEVCWLSQMRTDELFASTEEAKMAATEAATSARLRCNRLADYWVESMEWIDNNLGADDRLNSWWDYGHWTNYFGDRKTVLRNEHASEKMIGRVAHDFIIGSTKDLRDSMNYFDSRYVLFDVELIGGSSFGGKYGALNYLGCVHEGETTLQQSPGTSNCEFEHSPERVLIATVKSPSTICTISESQQRIGTLAYPIKKSGVDLSKPVYCVGDVTLATGKTISGTYYLDRRNQNGDLIVSKGFLRPIESQGEATVAEMLYSEQPLWPGSNGTAVGGMEDAKTQFYSSNLYRGMYLENLPGFDLIYKSKNGEVKIYRMNEFTGNADGKIGQAYSG
jgi:hypothetical protein